MNCFSFQVAPVLVVFPVLALNKQWQNVSSNSWWNKSFRLCVVDNWVSTGPWAKYVLSSKYRLKSLNQELFNIVNLNKSDTHQEQLLNEVHSWNWTITNNDHNCRGQPPLSSKKGCVVNRWKSDSVISKEKYLLLLRPVSLLFPRRSIYFSFVPFLYMGKLHCVQVWETVCKVCVQGTRQGNALLPDSSPVHGPKDIWCVVMHLSKWPGGKVRLDLDSMWCLCLMWSPSPNRFVLCGCPHIWPPRIIINIYICMCFWEFQLY
jgi:hypothetical protein